MKKLISLLAAGATCASMLPATLAADVTSTDVMTETKVEFRMQNDAAANTTMRTESRIEVLRKIRERRYSGERYVRARQNIRTKLTNQRTRVNTTNVAPTRRIQRKSSRRLRQEVEANYNLPSSAKCSEETSILERTLCLNPRLRQRVLERLRRAEEAMMKNDDKMEDDSMIEEDDTMMEDDAMEDDGSDS